jgi:hypothetical protein
MTVCTTVLLVSTAQYCITVTVGSKLNTSSIFDTLGVFAFERVNRATYNAKVNYTLTHKMTKRMLLCAVVCVIYYFNL